MNLPDFWQLCPEVHVYPLESSRHSPFLEHYGRICAFDQWVAKGFEIERDKVGGIAQRKGRNLYRFARVWSRDPGEREAIETGKRHIFHFFPMLDYVRAGISFDEFVTHPQHYRDFCLGSIANERGEVCSAIEYFRKALADKPDEARYAESFYKLRVATGDVSAPAEELNYFTNSVDSIVHSGRVDEWVKMLLVQKNHPEAARLLRRVAELLEAKISGRLPKGQYSGESLAFVTSRRDKFRKKLLTWNKSPRHALLMQEIEKQGGLPNIQIASDH